MVWLGTAVLTVLSWPEILDFAFSDFFLILTFWEASCLTEISPCETWCVCLKRSLVQNQHHFVCGAPQCSWLSATHCSVAPLSWLKPGPEQLHLRMAAAPELSSADCPCNRGLSQEPGTRTVTQPLTWSVALMWLQDLGQAVYIFIYIHIYVRACIQSIHHSRALILAGTYCNKKINDKILKANKQSLETNWSVKGKCREIKKVAGKKYACTYKCIEKYNNKLLLYVAYSYVSVCFVFPSFILDSKSSCFWHFLDELEQEINDYGNFSLEEVSCKVIYIAPEMLQCPPLLRKNTSVLRDENTGEALHNFASLWESVRSC